MTERECAVGGVAVGLPSPWFRRLGPIAALILVILAPGIWTLACVSPLWRDVDAYVQLTYPPGANTILLHGPLYCTLTRVPLWVGYIFSTNHLVSLEHFVWHTKLTDPGVKLLIVVQHLSFCAAAVYFVHSVAVSFAARMFVAASIALQPIFYAFAQCVGSETLGVILVTLLAGVLCRMARRWPLASAREYVVLALVLCCCILTRQVNRLLILAPAAAAGLLFLLDRRRAASRRRVLAVCSLLALTGLVALIWATAMTSVLCWRAHIPRRSKFGYTFLWRLNFLADLPDTARHVILGKGARADPPATGVIAATVDRWFSRGGDWDAADLAAEVNRALLESRPGTSDPEIDQALNAFAHALLVPPGAELRNAAWHDFSKGTRRSGADIAGNLFLTTDYAYEHLGWMPQAAALEEFAQAPSAVAEFERVGYFHLWNWLSCRVLWLAAALLACLALLVSRGRGLSRAFIAQLSLAAVGALMLLATCFFAHLQERFIVTAMQTALFAVFAGLASIIDAHRVRDEATNDAANSGPL